MRPMLAPEPTPLVRRSCLGLRRSVPSQARAALLREGKERTVRVKEKIAREPWLDETGTIPVDDVQRH